MNGCQRSNNHHCRHTYANHLWLILNLHHPILPPLIQQLTRSVKGKIPIYPVMIAIALPSASNLRRRNVSIILTQSLIQRKNVKPKETGRGRRKLLFQYLQIQSHPWVPLNFNIETYRRFNASDVTSEDTMLTRALIPLLPRGLEKQTKQVMDPSKSMLVQ